MAPVQPPTEGTPEFDERCERAMEAVCEKYAYTAQQAGLFSAAIRSSWRRSQDYVFNRIARPSTVSGTTTTAAERSSGIPTLEKVFSQYYEPEYHEDAIRRRICDCRTHRVHAG